MTIHLIHSWTLPENRSDAHTCSQNLFFMKWLCLHVTLFDCATAAELITRLEFHIRQTYSYLRVKTFDGGMFIQRNISRYFWFMRIHKKYVNEWHD